MKKRGIPSPDIADAFALSFAYPVQARWASDEDAGFEPGGPFRSLDGDGLLNGG